MKFDFSKEKFYDNHTHVLDMEKFHVTEEEFLRYYCHGPKYIKAADGSVIPSEKALECLANQGIILTLVRYMSEKFGCTPTLSEVIRCRNEATRDAEHLRSYIQELYDSENIFASTLESELPMGAPLSTCIPGRLVRLLRYEDVYDRLMREEHSYSAMIEKLKSAIIDAMAAGFMGVKGHIAERCGMNAFHVSAEEAEKLYPDAQAGNAEAKRSVYYAMFHEVMVLCGALHVPVHIHTGSTGMGKHVSVYPHDPVLMAPFLREGQYENTDLVFLHGGYPFTRNAAMMAFNFSNVYVDISQTLPWESLGIAPMLEEILALAPHNRILCGSGQHGCPETAWAAAKVAKAALASVMEKLVSQGLLSENQAVRSARMVLSENAIRLYHLA